MLATTLSAADLGIDRRKLQQCRLGLRVRTSRDALARRVEPTARVALHDAAALLPSGLNIVFCTDINQLTLNLSGVQAAVPS
jgi:hypothetical protein